MSQVKQFELGLIIWWSHQPAGAPRSMHAGSRKSGSGERLEAEKFYSCWKRGMVLLYESNTAIRKRARFSHLSAARGRRLCVSRDKLARFEAPITSDQALYGGTVQTACYTRSACVAAATIAGRRSRFFSCVPGRVSVAPLADTVPAQLVA